MATFPIVDEDGVATGGNVVTTEESIVPQGGIFDRPKGVVTGVPHSQENQARGVAEAAYWALVSGWAGLGVWAGFDHRNVSIGYVYRDPFGVIDEMGTPQLAAAVFKGALNGKYDGNGEFRISLIQGTVGALPSRINGLGGWNTSDTTANTVGGVYLAGGGGTWTSDALIVGVPMKLRIDFTQRVANSNAEPLIIRIVAASRTIDFRYKVYGVSAWQRLDATSGDVDYGFAQTTPLLTGVNSFVIDLSAGLAPRVTFNGTLLTFDNTPNGDLSLLGWQAVGLKVKIINNGNSAVDVNKLTALGTAGSPIAFEARSAPGGIPGASGPQGPAGANGTNGSNGAVGPAFLLSSVSGTLVAGVSTARFYNDTGRTLTIAAVRATVGTSPTGAAVIVDVNKNGSTIFTTQANRPTVAISGVTSGKVTSMNVTTLADGDYLTCDVDQIGSTVAGANLTVQVEVTG